MARRSTALTLSIFLILIYALSPLFYLSKGRPNDFLPFDAESDEGRESELSLAIKQVPIASSSSSSQAPPPSKQGANNNEILAKQVEGNLVLLLTMY